MPEAGSTMYWLIGAIVIAAVVIAIFTIAFPKFTHTITDDIMNGLLGTGSKKATEANKAIDGVNTN